MIEMDEKTFLHTIWYYPTPWGNHLGILFRQNNGPWTYRYRLWYADQDISNIYEFLPGDKSEITIEEMVARLSHAVRKSAALLAAEVDEVRVERYGADAGFIFASQPWASMRIEAPTGKTNG